MAGFNDENNDRISYQEKLEMIDDIYSFMLKNPQLLKLKKQEELTKYTMNVHQVTNRTAKDLISAARMKFSDYVSLNLLAKKEKAVREREVLIMKARKEGNMRIELDAMKDRDVIDGVYIQKVEHSGNININLIPASCPTK